MATEVASAYVSIGASTKGLGNDVRKEFTGIESAAAKSGAGIGKKLVTPIAAAFAAIGVAKVGKELINAGEAASTANARIGNIAESMGLFGDQAGTVSERLIDLANAQALATGVDQNAIKATQAKLLTFKELAASADDVGGMFDRATTAAIDLAAAGFGSAEDNAVQLGKALNDPITGLTALTRSGITFTEAEKDQIRAMQEAGDVAGAQGLIMAAIEAQVSGTAAATVNASDQMKVGWSQVTEQLGGAILPAFNSFAAVVVDKIFPALSSGIDVLSGKFASAGDRITNFAAQFEGVSSAGEFFTRFSDMVTGLIEDLVAKLPDLVAEFVPKIVEGIISRYALLIDAATQVIEGVVDLLPKLLPTLVDGAVELFTGLIDAVTTVLPDLIDTIVALVPQLVETLVSLLPTLIDGAVTLFTALVQALTQIIPPLLTAIVQLLPVIIQALLGMLPQLIEGAIALFTALVDAIPQIIPPLIAAIVDLLPKIVEALLGLIPQLIEGALDLFLAIVEAIPQIVPPLIEGVLELLPTVLSTLLGMLPQLLDAAFQLFTGIVEALPKIIPDLVTGVLGLLPEIVGTLLGMVPDLIQAGVDLIGGLVQGLWDAAGQVGEALLQIAKDAVGGFLSFLHIGSPSKLMEGYGENTGEGFALGVDKMRSRAKDALLGLAAAAPGVSGAAQDSLAMTAVLPAAPAPGIQQVNHISGLGPAEVKQLIDSRLEAAMAR